MNKYEIVIEARATLTTATFGRFPYIEFATDIERAKKQAIRKVRETGLSHVMVYSARGMS